MSQSSFTVYLMFLLVLSASGCTTNQTDIFSSYLVINAQKDPKSTSDSSAKKYYLGQVEQGQPNGMGTMVYPSRDRHSGSWVQGKRDAQGSLILPQKGIYVGNFTDDNRSGFGRFLGNSFEYAGHWDQNFPQGYGTLYSKGYQSFYAGYWNQGLRWGQGFGINTQKSYYRGDWQRNLPNGFGESITNQDGWFQGGWLQGRRSGYGQSLDRANTAYEGLWRAGEKDGYGIETRIDGSRYEGEWRKNIREGSGVAFTNNGNSHEGQWQNNKPWGMGSRTFAGGYSMTGEWQGDYIAKGRVLLQDRPELMYEGALHVKERDTDDTDLTYISASQELIDWLEVPAKDDSIAAQNMLIQVLAWSEKAALKYKDKLQYWSQQAARKSPFAAFSLATLYLSDKTVRPHLKEAAIELLQNAAGHTKHPGIHLLLGDLHYQGTHLDQDHLQASRHYQAAVKAGSISARNNLAWLLSTAEDSKLRNGKRALSLILPVVHNHRSLQYLDTLAAVYAELGDFASAQTIQQQVLRLAEKQDQTSLPGIEKRFVYYRESRPWRD